VTKDREKQTRVVAAAISARRGDPARLRRARAGRLVARSVRRSQASC